MGAIVVVIGLIIWFLIAYYAGFQDGREHERMQAPGYVDGRHHPKAESEVT